MLDLAGAEISFCGQSLNVYFWMENDCLVRLVPLFQRSNTRSGDGQCGAPYSLGGFVVILYRTNSGLTVAIVCAPVYASVRPRFSCSTLPSPLALLQAAGCRLSGLAVRFCFAPHACVL